MTFTIDASASTVCSIAGSTVSFIGVGTCVINANQAGNANYAAAPQVQQSFAVGKGTQTISFTSTAPVGATVGGTTYIVTAAASTSGLPVTFTIDASASTVCSIAGSTVSFIGAGTCVINANQAGNANYAPAPQVQQSFPVGKGDADDQLHLDGSGRRDGGRSDLHRDGDGDLGSAGDVHDRRVGELRCARSRARRCRSSAPAPA